MADVRRAHRISLANISAPSADRKANGAPDEDLSENDIQALVGDARRGNRRSFEVLYRRYRPPVFRLARFSLGPECDDAVAEVFVRAWKDLPRYKRSKVPFVSWLYGIARHVVTDELRRRGRVEHRAELPETGIEHPVDDRLDLAAALAQLPPAQREIIEMKYLLGLTNPEVAHVLRTSIGAVNAKQWRALKALKEILERGSA